MAEYLLFLDESEVDRKPQLPTFCIAGIIVEKNTYTNTIEPALLDLKRQVWHNITNPEDVVLHEMEVKRGNTKKSKIPEFHRFNQNSYMKMLYVGLDKIFRLNQMYVVGATVDMDRLNCHFHTDIATEKYLICMQILIENYVQFLQRNNAYGSVVCESRSETQDKLVKMRLTQIKALGSMFVNPYAMQKYVGEITFPLKTANVSGLQLADFVPNPFARKAAGKPQAAFNIYQALRKSRYDGGLQKYDRFGIKYMP